MIKYTTLSTELKVDLPGGWRSSTPAPLPSFAPLTAPVLHGWHRSRPLFRSPTSGLQLHPALLQSIPTEVLSAHHTWRYHRLGRHRADHRLLQRTGLINRVNRVYGALRQKKEKHFFPPSV